MLPTTTQSVTLNLADLSAYDPYPFRRGQWTNYLCPFCGADHPRDNAHRKLGLSDGGGFHCFRCGIHGRIADGASGKGRQRDWAMFSENLKEQKEREWQSDLRAMQEARALWRTCRSARHTRASAYLVCHRGLQSSWISRCSLRYCQSWFGTPALVFAGKDEKSFLNTAQGRYVMREPGGLKVRTVGKAKRGVFSTFALSAMQWPRRIAIAEAPLDAMSYDELFGVRGVASMGCWQQRWLLPVARQRGVAEVVLATDNDKAGEEAALRWAQLCMEQGLKSIRYRPPKEQGIKDFNDVLRHKKGLR